MGWFRAPAGEHHSDHRCRLPLWNEESTHVQIDTNWVVGGRHTGTVPDKAVCLS